MKVMTYKLYLNPTGAESYAKGQNLYSWSFSLRLDEGTEYEGKPTNSILVGSGEVVLPAVSQAIDVAMEQLRQREQEIQADAYKQLQEVTQRRNDLLMLAAPVAVVAEVQPGDAA